MICMKRSILLFLVLYFYILLSPIFAQSGQKSVIISGHVSYEGKGAQPKNIEVRIANSYTQPVKANETGFFNIHWNCISDHDGTYLLLYRTAEHCAKIVPVYFNNYSDIRESLKKAWLSPKSVEINILGNIVNISGDPIKLATVYLDNGATVGYTDSLGHFDIVADRKNVAPKTYLWIEKNSYKRKILPIDFYGSVRDTLIQNIVLEPINQTFDIKIIANRKGFKRDLLEDVTVAVNDSIIGVTNEAGDLTVSNFQIKEIREFLNFDFNHKYYLPRSLNNYLCDRISTISIPIDLEPLKRNLELSIYQAGVDGSKKYLANEAIKIEQKDLYYSSQKTDSTGKINLEVSILPGDTLHVLLPKNMFYDPEDTFVVFEHGKKYYELGVRKKNVKIEILTKDGNTGELISDVDSLAFNFGDKKHFLVRSDSSFIFLSEDFKPGDEAWITPLTQDYTFKPIKMEIISDSIEYSRNLFLKKINYGNLILTSEPDSAMIFIDEEATHLVTPDTLINIVGGEHKIKLTKNGYEEFEGVIDIKPNQNNIFHHQLKPVKKEKIEHKKWVQMSLEGGLAGWIFRYVHANNERWPIPTAYPKLGINFFLVRFSPILFKGSFYKGYFYFPERYDFNINEAELGVIAQHEKYCIYVTPRYTFLRSWKEVLAKFDGYSLDIKISRNIGSPVNTKKQLPILKNYKRLIEFGFERSFRSINKSFKGDFEKENQLYLGYLYHWKNNLIITSHLGYAFPKTKALDEDYKDLVELKNLVRIHLTLSYFFLQ